MMLLFGLKMFWDAYKMSPDEAAAVQAEVHEELQRRANPNATSTADDGHDNEAGPIDNAADAKTAKETTLEAHFDEPANAQLIQDRSRAPENFKTLLKLFANCFTMTFLAEWGDRSQLATIVLASNYNVWGVCVGASLGHFILTGFAVIAGAIVAKKISVRVITVIGGLVFLGFAIASLVRGLLDDELNGTL
jgi:putative Ca2+/H+ antiporter (TMEM165/GDT1 family)